MRIPYVIDNHGCCLGNLDPLTDQIVYKLYGLTDEEIAIVEGNPSS